MFPPSLRRTHGFLPPQEPKLEYAPRTIKPTRSRRRPGAIYPQFGSVDEWARAGAGDKKM